MKYSSFKPNRKQLDKLADVCLDVGKTVFLGSVAAFFIPTLVDKDVSSQTLVVGVVIALTFTMIGVILLRGSKA